MRWPAAVKMFLEERFERYYRDRSIEKITEEQWENWDEELQQIESM
jgi:hypothetical protein